MSKDTSPTIKLTLLALIVGISIFFSLPNFYGEQPAIQIKAKIASKLTPSTLAEIKKTLQSKQLDFNPMRTTDSSSLLRFKNTHEQLKAQEILHRAFPHLIIALNLASQTPAWLLALGATPMKLGLDLRGGVHFLLDVDIDTAIKTQLKQDAKTLKTALAEQHVKTIAVRIEKNHLIHLSFASSEAAETARALIKKTLPQYTRATSIRRGRLWVLSVMPLPDTLNKLVEYTLAQTITILNNRINELGVSEAVINRQGRHQISVDLPGIQDTARAKALLGKTATLRFHLVSQEIDPHTASLHGAPLGTQLYHDEHNRPIVLNTDPVLTGDAVTYASSTFSNGRPAVDIRLGSGAMRFHRITNANIGKQLAVIYIDSEVKHQKIGTHTKKHIIHHERVISVATIQSALGQQFQITGLHNIEYADNLALLLRSGALAAPVSIVEELTVGPSLGQANIDKGIRSLFIGSLAVIIFMLLYYRFFGFVANLALILNIFLIIATLSLLGATLTLPGIAGIVLTVGMAVDANVLINERIREELRLGLSPIMSIKAGYDRAFSTIVDANVTTLIVAMILFTLGSGSVKGFAITLSIGLIASMLTSIVFTRAVVEAIYCRRDQRQNLIKLSIGI